MNKICRCCHLDLPGDSFGFTGTGHKYRRNVCRSCQSKKDVHTGRARRWRAANKEHVRQYNRTDYERRGKPQFLSLKKEVVREYGSICECCKESRVEFLSIDHVGGGGNQHRREIGSGRLYHWLKANGFPKEKFRLLCMNCNFATKNGHKCPHELEREASVFSTKNGHKRPHELEREVSVVVSN